MQITVAEQVGVEARAGYYEQSGCLRDMIQNHTMQLLALTAMEPPVSMDAESVRDEKVKVLKAIHPLRLNDDTRACDFARAQYTAGVIGGKPVKGYLDEKDVAPASATEAKTSSVAGLITSIVAEADGTTSVELIHIPFTIASGSCYSMSRGRSRRLPGVPRGLNFKFVFVDLGPSACYSVSVVI